MALGVKKITESVIENGRALTTIGNYMPMGDYIDLNDNSAIDEGGLFTALSASGGVVRIKDNSCNYNQARINADKSIEYNSITQDLLQKDCVITDKIKEVIQEESDIAKAVKINALSQVNIIKKSLAINDDVIVCAAIYDINTGEVVIL